MTIYTNIIYNLLNNNKDAHTQAERVKVIYKHMDLIKALRKWSDREDLATNSGSNPDNDYQKDLYKISKWIENGRGPKSYRAKYPNEIPNEIRDNEKTTSRTYQGPSNYCISKPLKPTKSELKNKYIKQLYNSLKYYKKSYKNNYKTRFKITRAISQTQRDLEEAIKSYRGINHTGRTDNTVTPQPRKLIDHIDLENLMQNNSYLKDYFDGYSEIEISNTYGVSQQKVSYQLQKCYQKIKN